MKSELDMLKESNIMPIFLSLLKFALGEDIITPTGADPFSPWPFP